MDYLKPRSMEYELTKITKEAGITFAGVLLGMGLKYVCVIVIARRIGAFQFGTYALGLTILTLSQILSVAGLYYGILRYVSVSHVQNERERTKGIIICALKLVLMGSLLVGIGIFVGAETISNKIFSKSELSMVIRLFSLSLPFLAIIDISVFSIQAVQTLKYKVYVKDVYLPICNLAAVVVLFSMGLQIKGAIYAYVISAVLSALLGIYYLKKTFPDLVNQQIRAVASFGSLLRFSLPTIGMNVFGFGMLWTDTLMVGYFMSTTDVGIYNAAARTAMLINVILFSFSSIFMPMISDLNYRGEVKKLEGLLKTVTKWIFALSFPIFLLMAILSRQVMALFGSEFAFGTLWFLILALAQMINSSTGPVGNFLVMSGKQDIVFLDMAVCFCANVFLNYSLITRYAVVGAAIATMLSITLLNVMYLIEVYYFYRIHPFTLRLLKPFFGGIVAGLVSLLFLSFVKNDPIYTVPLAIFVFILCYVILFYVSGFDEEDRIISRTILRKYSLAEKERGAKERP
jgi:O-antigen/teichoic acid export membrane protein